MIEVFGTRIDLADPLVLAAAGGGVLLLVLLVWMLLAARRAARATEPLAGQILQIAEGLKMVNESQHVLQGRIEAVAGAQGQIGERVERRLAEVQAEVQARLADQALKTLRSVAELKAEMAETLHGSSEKTTENLSKTTQSLMRSVAELKAEMAEVLHGSSEKTTQNLTKLQERLAAIDKAQANIEKLSGDVLSLQDILSNKQTRGAFGEIQLYDIVAKALPPDSYARQPTLSNGARPDLLIHLPNPPGPIVIDAKFPLDSYEALVRAETREETARALAAFRNDMRKHIKDIAEKYLIEGETADGALMFLPSEAVYAELHARLPEIVRESFAARVWIVSPTTCMATLNTMRAILKDARMREQAGKIRRELKLLHDDVNRLGDRVSNLDRHFTQAQRDVEQIKISAEKASGRAARLDSFDFAEIEKDTAADPRPLVRER